MFPQKWLARAQSYSKAAQSSFCLLVTPSSTVKVLTVSTSSGSLFTQVPKLSVYWQPETTDGPRNYYFFGTFQLSLKQLLLDRLFNRAFEVGLRF